jgi:hypothetical protein
MDEPTAKKTVPLIMLTHGRRVKDQVVHYFLIAESADGNDTGNDDNNERN